MQEFLTASQKSKKSRKRKFKTFLWLVLLVAVVAGLVYLAVFSPLFKINGISVSGNVYVNEVEIEEKMAEIVKEGSLFGKFIGSQNFISWRSKYSNKLLEEIPSLRSAEIEKKYIDKVILIKVEEDKRVGIWCSLEVQADESATSTETFISTEICYWFNKEGKLLSESPRAEGSLLFSISDYTGDELNPGKYVLNSDQFSNVSSMLKLLDELKISVKEIKFIRKELQEITVETYGGPDFLFSIIFNPSKLLEPLQEIKDTVGFGGLQYIDLRSENRIFYQ